MLLIWKWGEILVNAVYCQAVLRRKSIVCGERGRVETGGIYKTQEVKISGSLYQFSKSALYFLFFSLKTNKITNATPLKMSTARTNLITRKWIISTSFHRNGDARIKKRNITVVYVYKSPPFRCTKSQMRNRSTPYSFGKIDARPRWTF